MQIYGLTETAPLLVANRARRPRPLQVPHLGGVRRRAAADGDRQGPEVPAARRAPGAGRLIGAPTTEPIRETGADERVTRLGRCADRAPASVSRHDPSPGPIRSATRHRTPDASGMTDQAKRTAGPAGGGGGGAAGPPPRPAPR